MILAEAADSASVSPIVSLFWIAAVAVSAPLIARLLRGYVPDVVILLLFGVVLGPHALGLADSGGGVDLLSELGLGMLFLLAGYELDPRLLGGRPGRTAWFTWFACLLMAMLFVTLVAHDAKFTAIAAIAIAMTSTALGTLLPIVKGLGILDTQLGRAVLAHGAVGELGPVVAMSVLLTSRNVGAAIVVLLLFAIAAAMIGLVHQRILDRVPAVGRLLTELSTGTAQLPVRVVFLLLLILMTLADEFGLDVVLGAFAAGVILRGIVGTERPEIGESLETIGFGVLIPIFFVVSGMGIDVAAVAAEPVTWVLFVVSIAVARGVPVWFSERFVQHGANLTEPHERLQLALYAATGLPIIVAVTQVATSTGLMEQRLASTMVAAGATTVLLFPLLARWVGTRGAKVPAAS
ncbi:cation:proton antiporter [Nocardia cyriacigeorgica]|uniref:Cation:proton antiporter n=1 Tax=Nocardia cyriacigeorgica TaxID=135487 RepID=A0A6P1D5D0_9NOCA|nr:cation:proton antiporter [Nocardia cyriacigeorgica]NEW44103.1 cation:proton antiporter [Nocardia cyriacigeorgica]NEW52300.1 cation:proton antiporter [Nocardia cyriacigeorgica]NEW56286.1 cation:proton antiporter [Nocardia cyriacigeorgica]